jgi:two-component system LytT family response regulator
MEKIRTVLVEDEEKSLETLSGILSSFFEEVNVVATARTVDEAVKEIFKHKPDLVFADISLPDGIGFDVLDKTKSIDFDIVFTTAYEEYSVDAFEYAALHYILKPISIDKLEEAIKRHKSGFRYKKKYADEYKGILNGNSEQKIAFNTVSEIIFKPIKDIVYCVADGNYTKVFFINDDDIFISQTLKNYEKLLNPYNFSRIHSKYLINIKYVKKFIRGKTGYAVLETGKELPVSEVYKKSFLEKIKGE